MLTASMAGSAFAAPVAGYEALYEAAFSGCTTPGAGAAAACTAAINAYADALVAGGVPQESADASFQELRDEVRVANAGNPQLLALIEGLFEELLPDTEEVQGDASPTG